MNWIHRHRRRIGPRRGTGGAAAGDRNRLLSHHHLLAHPSPIASSQDHYAGGHPLGGGDKPGRCLDR